MMTEHNSSIAPSQASALPLTEEGLNGAIARTTAGAGTDATAPPGFFANSPLPELAVESPLVSAAVAALRTAATVVLDEQALLVEERNIWQPESWLLQRCWETLANAATGSEALAVAARLADRQPLAPLQALYRLARQLRQRPALGPLLEHHLQQWRYRLFHTHPEEAKSIERLLLVATSAALTGDSTLAAACLERLDNVAKGWERVVARPELRDQLALCLVHIGPHPLVNDLINIAIRRFDDAGAQLLYAITTLLSAELAALHGAQPAHAAADAAALANTDQASEQIKAARLLRHCLDTLRLSTLVSLQSRRVAAMIFAQTGEIDEVLTQVATIERVQSAQRSTGYAPQKDDPTVLRQVKRSSANSDVDFLVYTLRNAIEAMPLRRLRREERIALADQLARLGIQSDGWTAASAAGTLVELGALRYAVEVVEHVSPHDPARSEGLLMLVRSLMALGENTMAAEQAQRALDWAESLTVRNPERALTWGLAEIYLHYQQPQIALQLLARWREPTGWRQQLRQLKGRLWSETINDDELRNRRLRLHALLQLTAQQVSGDGTITAATRLSSADTGFTTATGVASEEIDPAKEIPPLLRSLRRAAPRLLDGEALLHFYMDGLLRPLLHTGHEQQAWALLPDLRTALLTTSGNKHAVRVHDLTQLLLTQLRLTQSLADELPPRGAGPSDRAEVPVQVRAAHDEVRGVVEGFLRDLWRDSATRGTWQVVHSLEGALPLLLTLEGPAALVALAQAVSPENKR
jgi:hypothetical protein